MSRRTNTPRTLPIGTISSGTLRPEDLIPAYADALSGIRLSAHDRQQVRSIVREYEQCAALGDTDETLNDDLVDELRMIAENYVPAYCYVGSTDGDGAEIGVWPSWEAIDDDARSSNTGSIARASKTHTARELAHHGQDYALEVNDHGNTTLYRRAGRRWVECWAVV